MDSFKNLLQMEKCVKTNGIGRCVVLLKKKEVQEISYREEGWQFV